MRHPADEKKQELGLYDGRYEAVGFLPRTRLGNFSKYVLS